VHVQGKNQAEHHYESIIIKTFKIKNNDLREAVVTDAFLFLSTFFIQSTNNILTPYKAYVKDFCKEICRWLCVRFLQQHIYRVSI